MRTTLNFIHSSWHQGVSALSDLMNRIAQWARAFFGSFAGLSLGRTAYLFVSSWWTGSRQDFAQGCESLLHTVRHFYTSFKARLQSETITRLKAENSDLARKAAETDPLKAQNAALSEALRTLQQAPEAALSTAFVSLAQKLRDTLTRDLEQLTPDHPLRPQLESYLLQATLLSNCQTLPPPKPAAELPPPPPLLRELLGGLHVHQS